MLNIQKILDLHTIKNTLSDDAMEYLGACAEKVIPVVARQLSDFIVSHKDTEVSYCECIVLYVNIYTTYLNLLKEYPAFAELVNAKTIDIDKINLFKSYGINRSFPNSWTC